MIPITLYSKDGCHLCEVVKSDLISLQLDNPQLSYALNEVDITSNEDLFFRYRFSIPVVKIGNQTLAAPINKTQLQKALDLCD